MAVRRPRRQHARHQFIVRQVQGHVVVRALRNSYGHRLHPAHVSRRGKPEHSHLGRTQRHRQVHHRADLVHGACVGVQPRGHVHRHQAQPRLPLPHLLQEAEDSLDGALQGTHLAGAEHCVQHQVRQGQIVVQGKLVRVFTGLHHAHATGPALLEFVLPTPADRRHVQRHQAAPVRQIPCRHQAVAAVVAGTHQHQDPLPSNAVQKLCNAPRHDQASRLHKSVDRYPSSLATLFQPPHLLHRHYLHERLPTTEATA